MLALSVLALGTGVSTAVFSLLKDAWLDRLPVTRPHELVQVILEAKDASMSNLPYPETARWLGSVRGFDSVLFYRDGHLNLLDRDWTYRARGRYVSGSYYATLGVAAAAGRVLQPEDDRPSSTPVALISHELWTRRFARDPSVIGRAVYVSGRAFTIVGVTPRSFFGVDRLWVPEITIPLGLSWDSGQVQAIARLKHDVPTERARIETSDRLRQLLEAGELATALWPTRGQPVGARLESAAAGTWGVRLGLSEPLRTLSALALLMLLMTCLSLASIVHARTAARTREFGVRIALGADRGRLLRQILVECLILGALGGLAGLLLAFVFHRLMLSVLPVGPGAALGYRIDLWMLAFNTTVSLVSGAVFAVGPALKASRLDPNAVLAGGKDRSGPRRRLRFRAALAAQVAAALVLSVAAVLLVRTLVSLLEVDPGFDRSHTLLVTIDPEECQLNPEGMVALTEALAGRVWALPGLRAVGFGLLEASAMRGWVKTMWVEGHDYSLDEDRAISFGVVSPGFFAAAGIPLLEGRDLTHRDAHGTPPVAVINQALAEHYLHDRNPVGLRLGDGRGPATDRLTYEIVGVVGNARHAGLRRAPQPMVFHPLAQAPSVRPFVLHIRSIGRPGPLVAALRQAVRATDPRLVITTVRTIAEQTTAELRQERMFATLSTLFAGLGLCLCCVGLYGVTADSMERRTREIGIRIALGAERRGIVTLVLRETLGTVVVGLAVGGVVASVWLPSVAQSLLFGVAPTSLGALATAVAALGAASTAAAMIPAHRAGGIDPAVALRSE